MSDITSDMKTFTARSLDRETSRVLETCDAEGAVRIRHRNGRSYILTAQREMAGGSRRPDFQRPARGPLPPKPQRPRDGEFGSSGCRRVKPYADANFFTRLYLPLPESPTADRLAQDRTADFVLPVTWLLRCEVLNAIELSVFVSRSGGPRISAEQAASAQAHFREDLGAGDFLAAVDVPSGDWRWEFEELAQRHSARHGFRAYDLLHVAAALRMECDTFWSFDRKARDLAKLEGLSVNA